AADCGDGYYAIALQQGDEDLRDAIDEALDRIAQSGELRRILLRWNIDHERQARLATWSETDTTAMLGSRSHATFGWGHFVLFLQGALVTILVSTLSMTLAVMLGMVLALVRQYFPRPIKGGEIPVAGLFVSFFFAASRGQLIAYLMNRIA